MNDPSIVSRIPARLAEGCRPRVAGVLILLVGSMWGPAPQALAWGRIGHRASAKLAESRLTPAARAGVRDLLESGESLADASTWADEHRREMPESGPWHYVNVPISAPGYDPTRCPPSGCVVSKLDEFRAVLARPDVPREERLRALRFVVHLVQDLHQPLHVGDRGDRGGNDLQLQFFGAATNLHRIWDSGLIEQASRDEESWVRAIDALADPDRSLAWAKGGTEDWAGESHDAAKLAYLLPDVSGTLRGGEKLGDDYQDANVAVARQRLAQAGIRLASILNDVWK